MASYRCETGPLLRVWRDTRVLSAPQQLLIYLCNGYLGEHYKRLLKSISEVAKKQKTMNTLYNESYYDNSSLLWRKCFYICIYIYHKPNKWHIILYYIVILLCSVYIWLNIKVVILRNKLALLKDWNVFSHLVLVQVRQQKYNLCNVNSFTAWILTEERCYSCCPSLCLTKLISCGL